MDARAKKALSLIQRCVAQDRVGLTRHFQDRMEERGFYWPDVLVVVEAPIEVRPDGPDDFGRPKWVISGTSTDGHPLGIVCAIGTDQDGATAVFITVFWE